MSGKARSTASSICLVVGLVTTAGNAHAIECFPGPDFKPAPGKSWQYQIDPATNLGCWFIKESSAPPRPRKGEIARSSRSAPASFSGSESAATSRTPRSNGSEGAPAATPQSSIRAWLSTTFTGLPNSATAYSDTETGEVASTRPSVTSKRSNESSASRQQRSKSEQQPNVAQRKSEPEQSGSARPPHLNAAVLMLEAAGDKPVLSPLTLSGEELRKAIEAVGDKDVLIAPAEPVPEWQKALYEEFLRWRLRQLMPQ